MNTMNIKEAMANGMTKEDIMAMVEAAEAELAAEDTEAVDVAREELIEAILNYIEALGALPEEVGFTKEDIAHLTEMLKDAEGKLKQEVAMMANMSKVLGTLATRPQVKVMPVAESKAERTDTSDPWDEFLKSLQ